MREAKLIFTISLLFCTFLAYSQNVVGEICGDNDQIQISEIQIGRGFLVHKDFFGNFADGKWIYYEKCNPRRKKEASLLIEGNFLEGKKNGVFNYYIQTFQSRRNKSRLLLSLAYKNGVIDGSVTFYAVENNLKREESYYKNGVLEGFSVDYDTYTGKIKAISFYKHGILLYETSYDNNDKIRKHISYE